MQGTVIFHLSGGDDGNPQRLSISPFELAALVATRFGFSLDAQPVDSGWMIEAKTKDRTITFRGRSQADAARKLVGALWPEK